MVGTVVEVTPSVAAFNIAGGGGAPASTAVTQGRQGSRGINSSADKAWVEGVCVVGEVIVTISEDVVDFVYGGRGDEGGAGAGRDGAAMLTVGRCGKIRVEVGRAEAA